MYEQVKGKGRRTGRSRFPEYL